jgi:hypothetical protein
MIDMAVLLPGDWLDKAEEEDARLKMEAELSRKSAMKPEV